MDSLTIKATLEERNETRKFPLEYNATFEQLRNKIKELFKLKNDDFDILYQDYENWVTMSGEYDLRDILRHSLVHLKIKVHDDTQTSPAVKNALEKFESELTKLQEEAQQKAMEEVAKKAAASYHEVLAPLVQPSSSARLCSHCNKSDSQDICSACKGVTSCENCKSSINHEHDLSTNKNNFPPVYACDFCEARIIGIRHSCTTCKDFDLCQLCHKLGEHGHNPKHHFITHPPSTPKQEQVIPNERASSSSKQHTDILCDRCDENIVGVRYKCGHCTDYDLCERCETMAHDIHDPSHLFIKVRNPVSLRTDVPLLSKTCPLASQRISRSSTPRLSNYSPIHIYHPGSISLSSIHSTSSSMSKKSNVLAKPEAPSSTELALSAKFVNDMNIPDGTSLQAGRVVRKMWKMLNDGCDVWPNGTILQPISSNDIDMLRAIDQGLPATKPGSFVTVSTMITVPRQPGHYRTEFKLRSPNGQWFGDDLWVDIVSVPENNSNNNSMIYPTISTASSNSQRAPSIDITSVTLRHDELLDPSDDNDDDDDPFIDPSITSYTPSRRLSSTSLETSSDEEEEEIHHNGYDHHAQSRHSSSPASSDEFVVVDNNDQHHTQNPHERTPPKVTTPTASFLQQSSSASSQVYISPAPTPNSQRDVASTNPVPGLFDQQMRQIHEMGLTFCDELAIRLLTEYNGNVDRAVPEILERLYPE
ncbi:hypothetical protein K492DRAFT_235423 [Lichtheimia hyalospora FSU 10163]|nr:hypothetical protein K492DRAFT_235423 [Lichtheimia hyalospora FSU 10163]